MFSKMLILLSNYYVFIVLSIEYIIANKIDIVFGMKVFK